MEAMRCLKRHFARRYYGCSATDQDTVSIGHQATLTFPKSEPFTNRRRTMSATLQFDEDASRRVERIYTTPDVIEQRQTILRALALQPGERAIDIGSGPGLLACEMAVAVGTGGRICGVDVSENMLALARARRPSAGSGPIEYQEAGAHALPYADASFDVAVCTQVYELSLIHI